MGSTSCEPFLCFIFCARFARALCGSVCRKFAYSAYWRKRSTLVTIYFITFVFSFVQDFGNERSELEGLLKQVKNNADKKERRFGVMLTPFSSSKCSLINCQDDTETSFFLVRVFFTCFCITIPGLASLIREKATGSTASLLYVLWILFLETGHCSCSSCTEHKIM